jgi:hypothetical protein
VLAPPPIPTIVVSLFAVVFPLPSVIAWRESRESPWGRVFSSSGLAENLDTVSLQVDEESDKLWEHVSLAAAKRHPNRRLRMSKRVNVNRNWAAHLTR